MANGDFMAYEKDYEKGLADGAANVRKIGKWEQGRYRSVDQTGETYDDGEAVVCSVCRNAFKAEYYDWRWSFCPKCGARMMEEGDTE